MRAGWRVVELWRLNAADLLATCEPGLMPWVALTHVEGEIEPVLRECRRIIDEKAKEDEHDNLLAVTQVFLGLNHNDPALFSLLGGREVMIDSPVLRDLLAETPHKIILGILEDRFGAVPPEVVSAVTQIRDRNRLEQLARDAARCQDLESFRQRATAD